MFFLSLLVAGAEWNVYICRNQLLSLMKKFLIAAVLTLLSVCQLEAQLASQLGPQAKGYCDDMDYIASTLDTVRSQQTFTDMSLQVGELLCYYSHESESVNSQTINELNEYTMRVMNQLVYASLRVSGMDTTNPLVAEQVVVQMQPYFDGMKDATKNCKTLGEYSRLQFDHFESEVECDPAPATTTPKSKVCRCTRSAPDFYLCNCCYSGQKRSQYCTCTPDKKSIPTPPIKPDEGGDTPGEGGDKGTTGTGGGTKDPGTGGGTKDSGTDGGTQGTETSAGTGTADTGTDGGTQGTETSAGTGTADTGTGTGTKNSGEGGVQNPQRTGDGGVPSTTSIKGSYSTSIHNSSCTPPSERLKSGVDPSQFGESDVAAFLRFYDKLTSDMEAAQSLAEAEKLNQYGEERMRYFIKSNEQLHNPARVALVQVMMYCAPRAARSFYRLSGNNEVADLIGLIIDTPAKGNSATEDEMLVRIRKIKPMLEAKVREAANNSATLGQFLGVGTMAVAESMEQEMKALRNLRR